MDIINFFKFKPEEENVVYTIPNTTVEGSDSLSFTSNWTVTNVQGSTEGMAAFNYVNNPVLPINLKFHEDAWREYPNDLPISYLNTISGLASLQYPIVKSGKILPPYCRLEFNDQIYRGYFTNIKITTTGPFRRDRSTGKMHRVICEFSGQFTLVKSSKAPDRQGISSSLTNYFN